MIDIEEIRTKANQIRNLGQCKGLSEEELLEKAKGYIEQHNRDLNIDDMFIEKKEKKQGIKLLRKYLEDYSIETISDKNTLKQVIYLETLNIRLQEKLNEMNTQEAAIPTQLIDSMHKNLIQITNLKNTLGLTKTKEEKRGGFGEVEKLKEKFKRWRESNQASRTRLCPHCGKMVLWKVRPEHWESQKHPFFRDRILGNPHLVSMYQKKRITKEDVSKILEVAPDYVDWLINKWGLDLNKKAPSSLKQEETENNDAERNQEGSPANPEGVGGAESSKPDTESKGNSTENS